MRVHWFQHDPYERLGYIETWLNEQGGHTTVTRFFESDPLPEPSQVDFLIVMGGPMSVNDQDKFPWLAQEKEFLRRWIQSGKPVLGVCLGAQLIASAMGARVYRNRHKEIGWFSVQGIPSNDGSSFTFPHSFEAFHWHAETFDLPPGAIQLAKSKACEHQAFQLGKSVLGLQFHLEMTPETVRELVASCKEELRPSIYVQDEATIVGAKPEKYQALHRLMSSVLTFLTRTVG